VDHSTSFDRAAVRKELDRVASDYRALHATISDDMWRRRTHGTRWTNGEMMFHLMFGYTITWILFGLVRAVSWLPGPVQRSFAWLLDAATPVFNPLNFFASWLGGRIASRNLMQRQLGWLCARLSRNVAKESERSLGRGMRFPTRWDPFFKEFMTIGDVYRYPTQHYDFHRRQLSLSPQP
jgi:hypothetical protein